MSSITTPTSALSRRSSPGMNAVRLSFTKALICPEIQEHIPIFFIRLSSCVCKIMECQGHNHSILFILSLPIVY